MKKRLIYLLVAIVYIVSCLTLVAFADDNTINKDNTNINNSLVKTSPVYIQTNTYTPSVLAGSWTTLSVSLQCLEGEAASFMAVATADSSLSVGEVSQSGTTAAPTFTFGVYVPQNLSEGKYTVNLTVYMFDENKNYIGSSDYAASVNVSGGYEVTPALEFGSYNTDVDTIRPGDSFKLMFVLRNTGTADLTNVKVTLPGLNSSKFVIDGGFTYKTVDIKRGDYAVVAFDLIACDGISSVRETVSASAEYTYDSKVYTVDSDVVLVCQPKENSYGDEDMCLTVTGYKASSDRIKSGRVFTLSITVNNSSDNDIDKARLNIMGLDGSKFAVNSGLTYKDFSILAGESKTLSFELIGCDGISSTKEVLSVMLSYGDYSDTLYCTLTCKPETSVKETEVFAPNIIIKDYSFGGEAVIAGTQFPLTVEFENASSEAVIENLKITVNGGSSSIDGSIAYSASNSANSFFIEKLDSKSTDSVTLEMLAKSDAKPNSYPIEITFAYEYTVNGKRYQASTVRETLNIPLQQEDRLTVNEPSYPNWTVGLEESAYISTSLVNMGKSGVYNVTVTIEGEGFRMDEPSYYIGNIESGSMEYYDSEIYPTQEGTINCTLVVTYEDANGNSKEKRLEYSIEAIDYYSDYAYDEPIMGDDFYYEEPIDNGAGSLPIWVIIAAGAGVVVIVLVVVIVVVKKNKKKAALKAEYDDEDI